MADCLTTEAPAAAADYIATAIQILKHVDARNDLARAMVTKAALRRTAGDFATARQLLDQAYAIFEELGTRGDPDRIRAALLELGHGPESIASSAA